MRTQVTTMTTMLGTTVAVVSYINYQPYGGISSWSYGNGLNRAFNYDLDGRRTGISTTAGSTVQQSLTFGFNSNDEMTAITNGVDASQSHAFVYDELSRLTQDTIGGGATIFVDGSCPKSQHPYTHAAANRSYYAYQLAPNRALTIH